VGSDCGDGAEANGGVPEGASGTGDETAAAQSRADVFCIEWLTALHDGAIQSSDQARVSSFTWQHARCATHTLQLSVRAGLTVPAARSVFSKLRLVSKLSRTSTNFLRELGVAVGKEEAATAELGGRERVHSDVLVSRLIFDCPTRCGSTLAMLCRFVRVGPAAPLALSTYYHYTQLSRRTIRVEGPNHPELDVMSEVIIFLRVFESASSSLGSEVVATGSMEEAAYWCFRRAGTPNRAVCAALSALKRAVLSNMRERREVDRLRAPNPEWFGIRVAAVLLNPFYISETFGAEPSTATTARTTALAINGWMVARGAPALVEAPSRPGDGASAPLTKRRKTFESYLRESTAPSGGISVSAVVQPTFSLDAEWNAYLGRAVDLESQDAALDWWRADEQHFPRVALGARYLLAIPATSVTSKRVFLKAGRTISKLRARMTGVNAEQFIELHDDIMRRRRMERARGDSA